MDSTHRATTAVTISNVDVGALAIKIGNYFASKSNFLFKTPERLCLIDTILKYLRNTKG